MIVTLHVASGGAAGALVGSRPLALAVGPVVHVLGDLMPHEDIPSFHFELLSGVGALALLAVRRGVFDPATLGAAAAAAPDAEHRIRLPRPGGRKLFPSHRFRGWHRAGGVPAWAQLVVAGVVLGSLAAGQRRA
ncbi:MAG TPA: hypothetical protein VHF67_04710 [Gaiellaceae bacterium]|nr:hypothetical protein [Gaiellaceae bacterium]